MLLDKLITLILVFISGGILCIFAQLLIIKTKLTPARILVLFLVLGIFLELIGVFDFLYGIFKAGVSVPILGFGSALAKGAIEYALKYGFVGAFAGGLVHTAYGIGVAVVASYIVTLLFKPKTKM